MADLSQMLGDADFHSLPVDDRTSLINRALTKDADFMHLPIEDQKDLRSRAFRKANIPSPLSNPDVAETQRKAVEGGGTDMSDPLIENATIGIATGGMGLPLGMGFVPKTAAGKALAMAGGTAEQYLYGWASEKGARVGQAVGGAPGAVVGGLAAGGLIGMGESGLAKSVAGLKRLPTVTEEAASKAAAGAETKLYEDAPEDIYKFGEQKQAVLDKAKGKLTKTLKSASEAAAPKMADVQMTKFFGRTADETAAARTMPIEDLALHRANMRNATFGPINRISENLGKQFEVATAGQLHKQADNLDALGKVVTDENKWLNDRGAELSKPVRDLIKGFPQLDADQSMIDRVIEGNASPAVNVRFRNAVDLHTDHFGRPPTDDEMRPMALKALHGQSAYPTIGQLMGWRSEASRLVASQTDHNQVVAMRLREGLDQTLMDNGVQIPKELREKWATYKSMFDHSFRRNVATAVNPVGYGKKLFDSPERALTIVRGATPDERDSLKQLAADYVRSAPDPFERAKSIHPTVLKELFGDTPYQNFKPWLETDHKALAWEQFNTNPQVERIIRQGSQSELQEIKKETAVKYAKAGIDLARKLGPAGRGKLARILSTRDPIAQANIVDREFPVDPQGAQALYQQAQVTPGKEAFQKNLIGKNLQKGLDVDATREEAAVAALMKDTKNPVMANLKRRLFAWHLPMLIGGEVGGALSGHVGSAGYQLGISGLILTMMAGNAIRDMFRPAITDPAAARAYWRAIEPRPSILSAKRFGAQMTRVAMALAMKQWDKGGP